MKGSILWVVEMAGLEPATLALKGPCSTNWATSPKWYAGASYTKIYLCRIFFLFSGIFPLIYATKSIYLSHSKCQPNYLWKVPLLHEKIVPFSLGQNIFPDSLFFCSLFHRQSEWIFLMWLRQVQRIIEILFPLLLTKKRIVPIEPRFFDMQRI